MSMTGKTVVITGASRGIGEASARIFALAGANVVLLARSGGEIGHIAREIGDSALAITCAGGGSVLTISSGAAHNAMEGWSHYCASKAAAHMMTKALHKEEASAGIRAIGLSPGTVATEMQREIKASGVGPVAALDWSDHIPADWPAKALLWMCSSDADDFLGEEIALRDDAIRKRIGLIE
ncbi:MAG: SDR family NAD(P)-dependent oxidoreductase [Maritimibacter sp.]